MITTNRSQTTHKIYQHNLNQIRNILQKDNLTVTKADKNKAIVMINKTMLEQNIQTFIQENGITTLPKDPTHQFHKTNPTRYPEMPNNRREETTKILITY
jgi:hypothetical protein